MARPLREIIAHIRMVVANPSVSTTLIQTEDLEVLCDAAVDADRLRVALVKQTEQHAYPCSPHCAGYLREMAAQAENARLREALKVAHTYVPPGKDHQMIVDTLLLSVDVQSDDAVNWAASRWQSEVASRPLQNIHRRSLDTTWRQVIRHFGGDDEALCGPRHDELVCEPRADAKSSARCQACGTALRVASVMGTHGLCEMCAPGGFQRRGPDVQ